MANKYIFQLRRGWKYEDPDTGVSRDDWRDYEATKYIISNKYDSTATYYTDTFGTEASPRPTKEQVEAGGYYIKNPEYLAPLDGELTLEYDNGIPRLKIGNGKDDFSQLPYMSVDSFVLPKHHMITLEGGTAWQSVSGTTNEYYQDITEQLRGQVTPNSKIDLQPTPEQLSIFHQKDVAFTIVNEEDNTIKVYAVGIRPTGDYANIPVTITEVATNG